MGIAKRAQALYGRHCRWFAGAVPGQPPTGVVMLPRSAPPIRAEEPEPHDPSAVADLPHDLAPGRRRQLAAWAEELRPAAMAANPCLAEMDDESFRLSAEPRRKRR